MNETRKNGRFFVHEEIHKTNFLRPRNTKCFSGSQKSLISVKIKKLNELKKIVEKLRKQNKKIVTCNGTFDILHIGHAKFLQEAKQLGDVLIVGLNSDKSVKLNKGPKRPINNEKSRAEVLAALEWVDYVIIFNEKDPRKLLSIIKPDIHVNGEGYGYNCIEAETIKKYGCKIYLIKNYRGYSTTKLVKKIIEVYSNEKG